MKPVTVNNVDYYLFEERPKWDAGITGKFAVPIERQRSPTGRETVQSMGQDLRVTLQYTAVIYELEAASYRVGVQDLANQPVLLPFWPILDAVEESVAPYVDEAGDTYVDASGNRYVSEASRTASTGIWLSYERDWSAWEVHTDGEPSGFTPSATARKVPCLAGYFKRVPQGLVKTPEFLELAVDFEATGPAAYALQLATITPVLGPSVLDRTPQVFPIRPHWGTPEGGRADVGISRNPAGYNREPVEVYYPQNTERSFGYDLYLGDWSECLALLRFFRDRRGMTETFWAPQPLADCRVLSISGTTVTVDNAAGLGINRYIALFGPAGTMETHHVTAVDTDAHTLTLATASALTSSGWLASLVLCRFQNSELAVRWITNGQAEARVLFREVAPEYYLGSAGSDESYGSDFGALPTRAFVYAFTGPWATPKYYAQYERDINLAGTVYQANKGIHHDGAVEEEATERSTITVYGRIFEGSPWQVFIPPAYEVEPRLKITEVEVNSVGDASNPRVVYYGRIGAVSNAGPEITAEVDNCGALFDTEVPAVLKQPSCNVELFHPKCGLLKTAWEFTAYVVSSSGKTLVIDTIARTTGTKPTLSAEYFALGWLETGTGDAFQRQGIAQSGAESGGAITLTLNYPFARNPSLGDTIRFWPGCSQQASQCKAKFGNYANFRGYPFIPSGNPITNPIQESSTTGGKKG